MRLEIILATHGGIRRAVAFSIYLIIHSSCAREEPSYA